MKRRGRKLIFILAMLASFTMLLGCVKKNSENTTATVETPTPTPTETPEPSATPEPTATPEEDQTVVSAVEVEGTEEDKQDDRESDQKDTSASSDDSGSGSNDGNGNDDINNKDESDGNNKVNMNFADDYKPREELSDEEVGYGSDNVPEASGTVASGEGNQAKIASAVYVRSGPGAENEIIGSLSEGDTVVVLGNEDGWLKINYGNKVGYFYQDYVALDW